MGEGEMISLRGYVVVLICGLVIATYIWLRVFSRRLRAEYAFFWSLFAIVVLVFSAWRGGIDTIASWLGIAYGPALLILFSVAFSIGYLIHLSEKISILRDQNKRLAQEIALLCGEIRKRG
jgi:hypothetical protein